MVEVGRSRQALAERGKRLEYFTIGWNVLEGLIGVFAGLIAGSISLVGFGADSFIEVTSGAALLWRMSVDARAETRERNERVGLRIVGVCFLILAAYIGFESVADLMKRRAPTPTIPGIALAGISLVVMPILSRAKKQVGTELSSRAMHADAKQNRFLHVAFRHSAGGPSSECDSGVVVGRSGCCASHGAYHRRRGSEWPASASLRWMLKMLV